MCDYETLREEFRPDKVNVLFVGESRPVNGTFFYKGNSNLAKYTREAFSVEGGPLLDMGTFLEEFRAAGCFLVDLCSMPVNNLMPADRRMRRRESETQLANVLNALKPKAVVIVMCGIARSVNRAIRMSEQEDVRSYVLPFPAQGHQRRYVDELRSILDKHREYAVW